MERFPLLSQHIRQRRKINDRSDKIIDTTKTMKNKN